MSNQNFILISVLIIVLVIMYVNKTSIINNSDLNSILELQNVNEYHEFVQQLQLLNQFPKTNEDDSGIYIILTISTGVRKMKLGQAWIKEQNGFNLNCYQFDSNNNLIIAADNNTSYNVLDNESVIVGMVSLLINRKETPKSQAKHQFLLTAFPVQLDIARKIQNNKNWVPTTFFNDPSPTTRYMPKQLTSLSSNTNNIDSTTINGSGSGSGIALVTNSSIIPSTSSIDGHINRNVTVKPLPLNSYKVFQIPFIGNQRNAQLITKQNGRSVIDGELLTISGL